MNENDSDKLKRKGQIFFKLRGKVKVQGESK
jgi:hypothetical protein